MRGRLLLIPGGMNAAPTIGHDIMPLRDFSYFDVYSLLPNAAQAAAKRAIGTRYGEQLT
jgi:hypothetical protein